jgi:serine/threonine protein kinase
MCKGSTGEKNDAGTLRYMPPEMLQDELSTANPAIDVWAIGVMLYCMVFDKFPFNGDSPDAIRHKIIGQDFKVPKEQPVTDEFVDFLHGLLRKDPLKRMDIYSMKTHKWLLLSDSAIDLKLEIARESLKKEKQRIEDQRQMDGISLNIMKLDVNEEESKHSSYSSNADYGNSPNRQKKSSGNVSNEDKRKGSSNMQQNGGGGGNKKLSTDPHKYFVKRSSQLNLND